MVKMPETRFTMYWSVRYEELENKKSGSMAFNKAAEPTKVDAHDAVCLTFNSRHWSPSRD
jgi:hypothetical protein